MGLNLANRHQKQKEGRRTGETGEHLDLRDRT